MITLYEFKLSGNCHKVRLLLSLLNLPYTSVVVDSGQQAHKSPEFLEMNPFGQVPVLTDGNVVLRDSQAILYYLARSYGQGLWLPTTPAGTAQAIAWLSSAANEMRQGPNLLRLHHKFGRPIDLDAAQAATVSLFGIVEAQLSAQPWLLAGDLPSIADIALYPYIALAPEGHWDLRPYPQIGAWLARVQALPGYVGMAGMA